MSIIGGELNELWPVISPPEEYSELLGDHVKFVNDGETVEI